MSRLYLREILELFLETAAQRKYKLVNRKRKKNIVTKIQMVILIQNSDKNIEIFTGTITRTNEV